jgi:hypothetical protein
VWLLTKPEATLFFYPKFIYYKLNMKKQILALSIAITCFFATQPHSTYAASAPVKSGSAMLTSQPQKPDADYRVNLLKAYLEQYNSPLAAEADVFVAEADAYNIDYRLLPAMAGVESWFGTRLPHNTYNAWGWGIYGSHMTYFTSWEDGIHTISKELREKYMDKWGDRNITEIGRHYASDPKWSPKVMHFIYDMEEFETKARNKAISISL